MIADLDIFRVAKLMIDQHGDEAALHAAGRADFLLDEGDIEGATVWREIIKAIDDCNVCAGRMNR